MSSRRVSNSLSLTWRTCPRTTLLRCSQAILKMTLKCLELSISRRLALALQQICKREKAVYFSVKVIKSNFLILLSKQICLTSIWIHSQKLKVLALMNKQTLWRIFQCSRLQTFLYVVISTKNSLCRCHLGAKIQLWQFSRPIISCCLHNCHKCWASTTMK